MSEEKIVRQELDDDMMQEVSGGTRMGKMMTTEYRGNTAGKMMTAEYRGNATDRAKKTIAAIETAQSANNVKKSRKIISC